MKGFRLLRANEIDCRVATINEKGLSLLLYKDARVDQNILDETVGPMNWQRHHSRENANCTVSIWDADKAQWIEKEDTGTESYTEREKGLASDSFKRACFNWGIGRELYSAPFIWLTPDKYTAKERGGKLTTYDRFEVTYIDYDEARNIKALQIANVTAHKTVFSVGVVKEPPVKAPETPDKAPETAERGNMPPADEKPAESPIKGRTAKLNVLKAKCAEQHLDLTAWLYKKGVTYETVTEEQLGKMLYTVAERERAKK